MAEGSDNISKFGPEVSTQSTFKLHGAAGGGDVEECERLVATGGDVNEADQLGWTPLMYAVSGGHDGLVTTLLSRGADVNITNGYGVTAFSMASAHCGCALLAKLYTHLSPDLRQCESNNALHLASQRGRCDTVRWILSDTPVQINFVSPITGLTALMVAVVGCHLEVVECLLRHGADPTITSCLGQDVFHLTLDMRQPQLLQLLQENCATNLSKPEFQFNLIDSPNHDDAVFFNSPGPGFKTCNDDYDPGNIRGGRSPTLSATRRGVFRSSPTRDKLMSPYCNGNSAYSLYSLISPVKDQNRGKKRKLSNKIGCSSWLKNLTKRRARSLEDAENDDLEIAKQAGNNFSHLLFKLGLEDFAPIFKEQELDIWTFLTLTEGDLEIMGIHEEVSKQKVLKGIQMLRKSQL